MYRIRRMAETRNQLIGPRPYGIRLDTLLRLRWLAVGGQAVSLVIVHWGFGFALPIWPALAIVAVTAATNLALRLRKPRVQRVEDREAGVILGFDIVQLALLLYLTGGLANPFSELFLAPVLISATALKPRTTLTLGILVIVLATTIANIHHPLPWSGDAAYMPPKLFIVGMWAAMIVSVAFIGGYAWAVAKETRQLSDALAEAELVLAREQHLTALDGLAAAAAHELGTPLGTIAVVAREMERELPAGSPLHTDVKLLREQSERCRAILRTLTSLDSGDAPFDRLPITHLLDEVVTPHRPFAQINIETPDSRNEEPVIARNPAILYGLGNIVENAVDFARERVDIVARWNGDEVSIQVQDDGPGFAPEVINRIGEPYVTNRRRGLSREDTPGGLGLGFFIAKTLLERTGAALSLENRLYPHTGAQVRVRWPRAAFEHNLNRESAARPENAALTG